MSTSFTMHSTGDWLARRPRLARAPEARAAWGAEVALSPGAAAALFRPRERGLVAWGRDGDGGAALATRAARGTGRRECRVASACGEIGRAHV